MGIVFEWTPPDRHKIQVHIADENGWWFNEGEYDVVRDWIFETYPGCSAIGFYEDELEETNAIFMFDTEEQMTLWMLKYA
jgi:hypothetical protein